MALTLRLDPQDEKHIDELKKLSGESTASKAILFAIRNFADVKYRYSGLTMKHHETEARLKKIISLSIEKERIEKQIESVLEGK